MGDWQLPVGHEVVLDLPIGGTVVTRVARCGGGSLAMVFRLDGDTLDRIDRTIEGLGHRIAA
jgi:hypothetical protein